MSIGHSQNRTGIKPEKSHTFILKGKTVTAENICESRTSRCTPFGLVIAGSDVVFHIQFIENGFCHLQGSAVTGFRNIAADYYKINFLRVVNLFHRIFQIFHRQSFGRNVQICQQSKTERFNRRKKLQLKNQN